MLLRLFSLSLAVVAAASHRVPVKSLRLPTSAPARRCAPVVMEKGREAEDVSGAVANTFGDIFGSLFKPNAEKEAEIERAYQAQLEVAELRRNPEAYRKKLAKTEAARAKASEEFLDGIAWQRSANPLEAFKKRQQEGKVKPLGYEDEPKGGIPLPSASFGVGGEFGVYPRCWLEPGTTRHARRSSGRVIEPLCGQRRQVRQWAVSTRASNQPRT
jgi:hypothetical protein